VVLKLKTAAFASRTRTARLPGATLLPEVMFAAAQGLLRREVDGTVAFRLIGVGAQPLRPASEADQADLADPGAPRRVAKWRAVEALRARFGDGAIGAGRGFPPRK
jgi:DNA polymerase IV